MFGIKKNRINLTNSSGGDGIGIDSFLFVEFQQLKGFPLCLF